MAPTMLQHPTSTGTEESRSSPTALTTTTTTTTNNNNNNPFEAERRILLEQMATQLRAVTKRIEKVNDNASKISSNNHNIGHVSHLWVSSYYDRGRDDGGDEEEDTATASRRPRSAVSSSSAAAAAASSLSVLSPRGREFS